MEWNESLQKIRKQKGFTQQQIADIFITTQQQYSKYETRQQEMTVTRIIELCNLFKVSADQLLGLNYYEDAKGKTISKYEKLKEEIFNIIRWAEYNEYITENGAETLESNIYRIIQDLDRK